MTDVNVGGLDAASLKILQKAAVVTISQQSEFLSGSQGLKFAALGTGFGDFDAKGFAQTGTLSEFEIGHGDVFPINMTNINVPIASFWAAVKTGSLAAVENVLFSGDDKFDIVGSINGAPAPVF